MSDSYTIPSNRSLSLVETATNGSTSETLTAPTTASELSSEQLSFDDAVFRHLCEIDCGIPLLFDRLKQSSASCRETAAFFRKRALLEDEYARANTRLARSTFDSYRESEGKAGSFVTSFASMLRTHEVISDNHLRLANQLTDMADQLTNLSRETDKARKQGKDVSSRVEKTLGDAEAAMEKARVRFDSSVEELERCLVAKAGESSRIDPSLLAHSSSTGPVNLSLQQVNPQGKRTFGKAMSRLKASSKTLGPSGNKTEDDLRGRMAAASDAYQSEVQSCQAARREHWVNAVPRILRSLKESSDEVDNGTQYHLMRYAQLYENVLLSNSIAIAPPSGIDDSPGFRSVIGSIDNRDDFKRFMEHFNVAWQTSRGSKAPISRGDGMLDQDGYVAVAPARSSLSDRRASAATVVDYSSSRSLADSASVINEESSSKTTFGVSLEYQMNRDGSEVPRILEECVAVIEAQGLEVTGIYRLSGTTSKIQKLKAKLDLDVDRVDLSSPDTVSDVNDITGVLKLWFRELPDPLMTTDLYLSFIEAARIENDRLRHIRLHERVNELPDSHYATLKFLMCHLNRIASHEKQNQMSISNLAIVFGPTLFRPPRGAEGSSLQDMTWQCKAIETILSHYEAIFVPVEEA